MTAVIAFPFRVDPNTHDIVTVEEGSDAETAMVIGMLAHTRIGERSLAPGFGTTDPAYVPSPEFVQELQAGLALFGPPARITGATVTLNQAGTVATIDVAFTPQEETS